MMSMRPRERRRSLAERYLWDRRIFLTWAAIALFKIFSAQKFRPLRTRTFNLVSPAQRLCDEIEGVARNYGNRLSGSGIGASLQVINRCVQRDMFTQCDRADDIGTADDANDLASLHYRQPFDLVRCHELSDLLDRGLFVDADDLLAHDRLDVFPPFGEDVGFGHNTNDLTVLGGYRRTTDLILDQGHRQIFHGHRWSHGDDISGHYIFGNHLQFPPRPH